MSKCYYLIFRLPNTALNDSKLAYSVCEFRTEVKDMLPSEDKRLIDLFYLKYDNINLLAHARRSDSDPDQRGRITCDEFSILYGALKDEEKVLKNDSLLPYFMDSFKLYLAEEAGGTKNEKEYTSWEDRLAALYYEHAMKCGNKFVADWFKFNLNISNVLTVITCRKCGLGEANYIVRHSEIAESTRMSSARDLDLDGSIEYLSELQHIAEETGPIVREERIDLLKWKWLGDNTFFKTFDIGSVLAYLLKLEMIERWAILDKARGEKTFRELVDATKMGSENVLEESKRNNIK